MKQNHADHLLSHLPADALPKRLQWVQTRWVYLAALLLGLCQALVFDLPFDSSLILFAPLLSVLSLTGFLLILQYLTPRRAMLFGYVFGLGLFGWGLNWVYISMARFGGAPFAFAVGANALVVMYLALYWLLGAYLIARLGRTPNQRLLLAAPLIALLEWVRAVFFIGFPWLSVGYGWIDTPFSRLASFGGVFFLSFIVILAVALCLLHLRRLHKALLLIKYFVLLLVLSIPFFPSPEENGINVALLQGNMPVITEYNDARMTENLLKYMALTDTVLATESNIDVMIWPESAIPYFYRDARDFLSTIADEQRKRQFDLITGVPHAMGQGALIYNGIVSQPADGSPVQFYHKQHLLPFGEYLPFRRFFAFFKDYVDIPMADFSRGDVVQAPFQSGGTSFAPAICFEAAFGDEIRQNARHAEVLLNVSNDAWFGQSKAQAQHLNITRMRAVENQKYLVRATNDGLTAIIRPNGSVQNSIPPFKDGYAIGEVIPNERLTLYARFGDTPWLLLFAVFALLISLMGRRGLVHDISL